MLGGADGAISYYEDQKVGLGLDFLAEVEQALGKIQQNPNLLLGSRSQAGAWERVLRIYY